METWQAINTVRVVRRFAERALADEHLERILNAARRPAALHDPRAVRESETPGPKTGRRVCEWVGA